MDATITRNGGVVALLVYIYVTHNGGPVANWKKIMVSRFGHGSLKKGIDSIKKNLKSILRNPLSSREHDELRNFKI